MFPELLQSPEFLQAALLGVLGLVVGSFLNVCIIRLPKEESVVRPPSRCPGCGKGISWYDNIPVFSWLLLRGRCRNCRAPISPIYPLIELTTGVIWATVGYHWGLGVDALRAVSLFTVLLGIAMTDAREYIIPDEFSVGGLVLGLLLSLPGGVPAVGQALLGASVGFLVLWVVGEAGTRVFKEEAMGGGDIKMMAMVGAFLGWQGVLLTIFLGALLGSLLFVPLALVGRRKLVPFGVFLALGAAATYLYGPTLLAWYGRYLNAA
jgi:leader peptidase (prepilin peptidase) / N-methyltransferase